MRLSAHDMWAGIAVFGKPRSGKSTLLHCLAGLDTVDAGTIRLDGVELTTLDEHARTRLRRDRVGFVFQSHNLLPVLTAEENVTLPLAIAGRRPAARPAGAASR